MKFLVSGTLEPEAQRGLCGSFQAEVLKDLVRLALVSWGGWRGSWARGGVVKGGGCGRRTRLGGRGYDKDTEPNHTILWKQEISGGSRERLSVTVDELVSTEGFQLCGYKDLEKSSYSSDEQKLREKLQVLDPQFNTSAFEDQNMFSTTNITILHVCKLKRCQKSCTHSPSCCSTYTILLRFLKLSRTAN